MDRLALLKAEGQTSGYLLNLNLSSAVAPPAAPRILFLATAPHLHCPSPPFALCGFLLYLVCFVRRLGSLFYLSYPFRGGVGNSTSWDTI